MNAFGTQLRDQIDLKLTRLQLTVYVDAVPESGEFLVSVENKRANAGRDGRSCLTRSNSQA